MAGRPSSMELLRKEPVRSETASWVFVAGLRVYFATAVAATTLVPVVFAGAPLEQAGGILVFVGLLALGRFALATASLDTGSPFGGMGSSREMTVAALAEPARRGTIRGIESHARGPRRPVPEGRAGPSRRPAPEPAR